MVEELRKKAEELLKGNLKIKELEKDLSEKDK
jgi:hypothetical protein